MDRPGWFALYEQERQKIEDYLAQLRADHEKHERSKRDEQTKTSEEPR